MLKTDHTFHFNDIFELESAEKPPLFQLKSITAGNLTEEPPNVAWVCHAPTGSADFTHWWAGLSSPDGRVGPCRHFIDRAHTLGGRYGSTGPLSNNPATRRPYHHDCPALASRDVVRASALLGLQLRIRKLHALIG